MLLNRNLEPAKRLFQTQVKKKWHWSVNNRSTRKLAVYILKVFVVFVSECVSVCVLLLVFQV